MRNSLNEILFQKFERFQRMYEFTSRARSLSVPERCHQGIYYSKLESVGGYGFQICLCIPACVMTNELHTREVYSYEISYQTQILKILFILC